MTDSQAIRNLCDSWKDAVVQPDGSIAIGRDSERFRLLANSVAFHDLDYDSMRAACIGLTSVLLLPGQNTVVDRDHHALWSWCGQLLCGSQSPYFNRSMEEYPLRQLMELCFRASLVGTCRPGRAGWEQMQASNRLLDVHAQAWMLGSHTALAFLAFPMLEGVTKRHCSDFVQMDGRAIQTWKALQADGNTRTYQPGRTCSSLWSLLELLRSTVASDELRGDLTQLEAHFATFSDDGSPGFKVLYDWRNGSLHGASLNSTVGGTVLNMAILIALSSLREDYDAVRRQTLDQVRYDLQSGSAHRSPWSYYPPYT